MLYQLSLKIVLGLAIPAHGIHKTRFQMLYRSSREIFLVHRLSAMASWLNSKCRVRIAWIKERRPTIKILLIRRYLENHDDLAISDGCGDGLVNFGIYNVAVDSAHLQFPHVTLQAI